MSAFSEPPDTALAELIRFSLRAVASNPSRSLRRFLEWKSSPNESEQPAREAIAIAWAETLTDIDSHAAPLAPLRDRDETALADLFERDDLDDIATDVITHLLWLWPEPCWDEDIFEFLGEFV